MARNSGKVHVVRVSKTGYVDKLGRRKDYSSAYLRRTFRDGGTVKNETVANLSALPDDVIDLIDAGAERPAAGPRRRARSPSPGRCRTGTSPPCTPWRAKLGLPALLGPAGRHAGPGPGADHLPGGPARLQAVHPDLVGRHHPGRRPRRRGRVHR